ISSTGNSCVPFYTAALCSGCWYATIDSSGCHYGSYCCLGTIFWTWCPGSSTLIAVDHGEPLYLARTNTRGRFPALGGRHSRHCIGCPTTRRLAAQAFGKIFTGSFGSFP